MDFSWIASPYGVILGAMACLLAGFIVSRGVYFDKDDRVLKIGSKRHPETLRQFNDLFEAVKDVRVEVKALSGKVCGLASETDALQIALLKMTITNEQLPANVRAEAYDEYRDVHHKNGWVEVYYETNVKPLLERQAQNEGAQL